LSTEPLTLAPWREPATIAPPRSALIIGGFLAGGIVWGVVARLWMRLITTDPEFTWSGTLFIVGAFAVAATAQGVALAVRRRQWPRWAQGIVRSLALVLALPLGAGAGIAMLPTLVTGPIALGRTNWRWGWRVAFATVAVVNVVALLVLFAGELPWVRAVTGWLMMIVVYGVIVGVLALTVRPVGRDRGSAMVAPSVPR
jgi:hypothetical protein